MAREGLRSHLTGSVPVSIAAHLVVLLVLVVVPLVDIVLPIPAVMMPSYVLAAPLPPPPAYVPRAASAPSPAAPTGSVPLRAPDRITEETPTAPTVPDGAVADTGLPPGFGEVGSVAVTAPPAPPAPEPPRQPPGPVRVAQLPEPPRKIVDVHPVYPDIARQARKEGTVVLEALLDTAGRVTQLRVIKSEVLLDQAAVDAVKQWRYTPSTYGGRPVSVLMTITVRFTLQQ
jgi:protein TonB